MKNTHIYVYQLYKYILLHTYIYSTDPENHGSQKIIYMHRIQPKTNDILYIYSFYLLEILPLFLGT